MGTVDRQFPFQPKISLGPSLGIRGNDWNHQSTGLDLPADGGVPSIPAPQFALIEPNLDARGTQSVADFSGGFGVLLGITQKNRSIRSSHAQIPLEIRCLAA
jgi:hypothetical protein